MLGRGFFIGGGYSSSTDGENRVKLKNGQIVYSPSLDLYVDEQDRVYYSDGDLNAKIYLEDGKVFAKVVQ
ncbi:hypothetical protein [Siminovitchia sp. 179-K 8D1 HS]|uniref:hypothetical protein n=1 Tax=Siminovitchia sp. 179-K 8D1 HS TaxID=3142385 RepID=UPI0039A0EE1D